MISVKEARTRIDAHTKLCPPVCVPIAVATGSVLAENIIATFDYPMYDQSAMDGYALKYDDGHINSSLEVVFEVAAGDTRTYLLPESKCAKIFTGAAVPEGADTIVIRENVLNNNDKITFNPDKIKRNDNIRFKGSQTIKGETILKSGTRLTPASIGLLAMFGINEISVYPAPRIGIITTGNEVIYPGEELMHGQVYNTNMYILSSALLEGRIEPMFNRHIRDDRSVLSKEFEKAINDCDILMVSGGISGGDYDLVRACLLENKVEEVFYKVAQRPGKVLFFGTHENKLVFGLPGNPAATLTCFYEYVVPAIRKMCGLNYHQSYRKTLKLKSDLNLKEGYIYLMKGLSDGETVHILSDQESFKLNSFSKADCLVEINNTMARAGDIVNVNMINQCWI